MGIFDYFKPVSSLPAEKVREFLKEKNADQYNLIDVRQPGEYERAHIPGAQLIPLADLRGRSDELDPGRLTITYCAMGMRSRAAASQLSDLGFREVYSMEGGINAWHGVVAEGAPEAGMPYFSPADGPLQFIALAWLLEEGSRKFYQEIMPAVGDEEAGHLFGQLIAAEEHHKISLVRLYKDIAGKDPDASFPGSVLRAKPEEEVMEGGIVVAEAVKWAKGKPVKDVLDLSISLEANSYDLYIRMRRAVNDEQAKKVFTVLSDEEKTHLERLAEAFERRI